MSTIFERPAIFHITILGLDKRCFDCYSSLDKILLLETLFWLKKFIMVFSALVTFDDLFPTSSCFRFFQISFAAIVILLRQIIMKNCIFYQRFTIRIADGEVFNQIKCLVGVVYLPPPSKSPPFIVALTPYCLSRD